jgi:hypothetical protein
MVMVVGTKKYLLKHYIFRKSNIIKSNTKILQNNVSHVNSENNASQQDSVQKNMTQNITIKDKMAQHNTGKDSIMLQNKI